MADTLIHSQFSRNKTKVYPLDTTQDHWIPLEGCDILSTVFDGSNNTVDDDRLRAMTEDLLMIGRDAMTEAMIQGFWVILKSTQTNSAADSFISLAFIFLQLLANADIRTQVPHVYRDHKEFLDVSLPKYFDEFYQGVDGDVTSHLHPQNVDGWTRKVIGRLNLFSHRTHTIDHEHAGADADAVDDDV